jgi:hypothetical protein
MIDVMLRTLRPAGHPVIGVSPDRLVPLTDERAVRLHPQTEDDPEPGDTSPIS